MHCTRKSTTFIGTRVPVVNSAVVQSRVVTFGFNCLADHPLREQNLGLWCSSCIAARITKSWSAVLSPPDPDRWVGLQWALATSAAQCADTTIMQSGFHSFWFGRQCPLILTGCTESDYWFQHINVETTMGRKSGVVLGWEWRFRRGTVPANLFNSRFLKPFEDHNSRKNRGQYINTELSIIELGYIPFQWGWAGLNHNCYWRQDGNLGPAHVHLILVMLTYIHTKCGCECFTWLSA